LGKARWAEMRGMSGTEQEENPMQPQPGWVLICKRQLVTRDKIYPVGSAVPLEAVAHRLQTLLDARFVYWTPPPDRQLAQPRDLPAQQPATQTRPTTIEIISDSDPVVSWKKTKEKMTEACGGDAARALDMLVATPAGAALFKLATQMATAAEARKQGRVSVEPVRL
jgi:hypothetical protein